MTAPSLREAARIHATKVGSASARARGLDDWDDEALRVAHAAERAYLAQHPVTHPTERIDR